MDEGDGRDPLKDAFPLSALVGGGLLTQALQFLLVSPDLRSVLICGPSGTAKSVAARSVAGISDRRVVEVPVGVTREQLFGSVDIEKAMREGRREVSESLIDRADGNILVADNVNLQPPEILHSLLNAVQESHAAAEMDGVSLSRSVDAKLIATMNPDEGELDEHILDRFDICVFTEAAETPEDRREIVRRNLEHERDRRGFCDRYAGSQKALVDTMASADYRGVEIPDGFPRMISEVCGAMHVEGHRGDLAVLNTVRASAACGGRRIPTSDDLKLAVKLCLQHRRRDVPPPEDDPPEPEEPPDEPPEQDQESEGQDDDESRRPPSTPPPQDSGDSEGEKDDGERGQAPDQVFAVGEQFEVADYIPPENKHNRNRRSGRQDTSISRDGTGRTVGYMVPRGKVRDVALIASIRTAAPYQLYREHGDLAIVLRQEDLRERVRVRRKGTTVMFVVDGSGSMGAQSRMVAVKGAILSMLDDAYKKRDSVGLTVFRGESAETVLPPTRSILNAYRLLETLPTGGRTPLVAGLQEGYRVLRRDAEAGLEPVMAVLTDGKGNEKGGGYATIKEALDDTAEVISESGIRTIVVDTEAGLLRFGKALELASKLDATYIQLENLDAENLSSSIRSAMGLFGH